MSELEIKATAQQRRLEVLKQKLSQAETEKEVSPRLPDVVTQTHTLSFQDTLIFLDQGLLTRHASPYTTLRDGNT